jgi:hypothetical protein
MPNRKFNVSLRGNVISGVIAALIWVIITAVTGGSAGLVIVGGVILGVAVFAVSFLISRLIIRAHSGRMPH